MRLEYGLENRTIKTVGMGHTSGGKNTTLSQTLQELEMFHGQSNDKFFILI